MEKSVEDQFNKIKSEEAKNIILKQQMRISELKEQFAKTHQALDNHMTYVNKQAEQLKRWEERYDKADMEINSLKENLNKVNIAYMVAIAKIDKIKEFHEDRKQWIKDNEKTEMFREKSMCQYIVDVMEKLLK